MEPAEAEMLDSCSVTQACVGAEQCSTTLWPSLASAMLSVEPVTPRERTTWFSSSCSKPLTTAAGTGPLKACSTLAKRSSMLLEYVSKVATLSFCATAADMLLDSAARSAEVAFGAKRASVAALVYTSALSALSASDAVTSTLLARALVMTSCAAAVL